MFLDHIRGFAPVFLDTDVDMTRIRAHRAAARSAGRHYSTVTYLLYAAARVLARHPEANAAIRGHAMPRIARYDKVSGKFTMDKRVNGQRIVMSAVIADLDSRDLDSIQERVEHYRDGDPETMPEYARVRKLYRIPWPLRNALFGLGARSLSMRPAIFGTFAVTSLGHRPVDGFYSTGGTTITLGLGQVADRPVVRDGQLTVAPLMRLSLTFDHRVIDGAEAADVLTDLKTSLEEFAADDAAQFAPSTDETVSRA
jgi:pyruvate/2-oxoglutarate dehydrogenase complex dihydrolipoamide acyltransferase (E2) component